MTDTHEPTDSTAGVAPKTTKRTRRSNLEKGRFVEEDSKVGRFHFIGQLSDGLVGSYDEKLGGFTTDHQLLIEPGVSKEGGATSNVYERTLLGRTELWVPLSEGGLDRTIATKAFLLPHRLADEEGERSTKANTLKSGWRLADKLRAQVADYICHSFQPQPIGTTQDEWEQIVQLPHLASNPRVRVSGQQVGDLVVRLDEPAEFASTEAIYPHARTAYCLPLDPGESLTEIDFDIEAPTGLSVADDWLRSCFPDPNTRTLVLEFIGSVAYGHPRQQRLLLAHGQGETGKTLLSKVLLALLPGSASVAMGNSSATEDLKYLSGRVGGKDLGVLQEMKWHSKGITDLLMELKRYLGGEAPGVVRSLFKEGLADTSRLQFFAYANNELDLSFVAGDLKAWERRLLLVPMREIIKEPDDELGAKLCKPEVLGAVALAGLQAYAAAALRGRESGRGYEAYTDEHLATEKRKVFAGRWAAALDYLLPDATGFVLYSELEEMLAATSEEFARLEGDENRARRRTERGRFLDVYENYPSDTPKPMLERNVKLAGGLRGIRGASLNLDFHNHESHQNTLTAP